MRESSPFFRAKKKGIGELLAVIIVIAITVIAGIIIYSFVLSKISMFGNSPGLQVENVQITNNVVILSIKNTGAFTFTQISFQIYANGNQLGTTKLVSLPSGGLAPGEGTSYVGSFASIAGAGNTEQPGTEYTIVITGIYNNGQTYTVSTNVVGS